MGSGLSLSDHDIVQLELKSQLQNISLKCRENINKGGLLTNSEDFLKFLGAVKTYVKQNGIKGAEASKQIISSLEKMEMKIEIFRGKVENLSNNKIGIQMTSLKDELDKSLNDIQNLLVNQTSSNDLKSASSITLTSSSIDSQSSSSIPLSSKKKEKSTSTSLKKSRKGTKKEKGNKTETSKNIFLKQLLTKKLRDPWHGFKSTFGGKMSPPEEYNYLVNETPFKIDGDDLSYSGIKRNVYFFDGNISSFDLYKEYMISVHDQLFGTYLQENESNTDNATLLTLDSLSAIHEVIGLKVCNCSFIDSFEKLHISPLHSLVSLQVIGSNIVNVEDTALERQIWLRDLGLVGLKLKKIPNICNLPKLLCLDISFNSFPSVQSNFQEILKSTTLHELNLSGCELTLLEPDTFSNLPSLIKLNISYNNFPSLEVSLEHLVSSRNLPSRLVHFIEYPNPYHKKINSEKYNEVMKSLTKKLPCIKEINNLEYKINMNFGENIIKESLERSVVEEASIISSGKESCSCKEGNACLNPENCQNWSQRYEVARTAREEKYDNFF